MMLIVTIVNILLLYVGANAVVKKATTGDGRAITILNSIITLLVVLSFLYYLILALNQTFGTLLILLTAINLGHIYFTKGFFKNYRFKILSNNHIWALAAVFFLTLYFVLYAGKYGSWDAFAIWNLHAKFLYNSGLWHQMFANDMAYSHRDYPLMLPSIIAFFWNGTGGRSPFIPLLFCYGLLVTVPLYVYFSLRSNSLKLPAYIALAILVADTNFKELAVSQCADILFSLMVLIVFVQYNRLKNGGDNRAILLGFICASCAWIKNEGLVFYILFTIGFLVANYRQLSTLKKYAAGLIIPTLVLVSFKLFFAPANDLVSGDNKHLSSVFAVLSDAGRYSAIFKFWLNTLVSTYPYALILIFAAFIINRKFFSSLPALVIAALLTAYFLIYLLTPYDLAWHLSTSVSRLFLHVYPALIYLVLLSLGNAKNSPAFFRTNSAGII